MRRLPVLLILLVSLMHPNQGGAGQSQIEFKDPGIFFSFGEKAVFQVKVEPVDSVKELYLEIQPEGQNTLQEVAIFNSLGEVVFTLDLKHFQIRPFSRVNYWFRVVTFGGLIVESARFSFFYEENTRIWKQVEEGRFIVKWYEGDDHFGQVVLNTARSGLQSVSTILPLTAPPVIRIYVFKTARDLQDSLMDNSQAWAAGHTAPDLNVILVSISPGSDQQREMERQIPHELAHIAIYQITGTVGYGHLPAWLNEGIASLVELTPNTDYRLALERAVQSNQLISMESLCSTFPKDASGAFLAYAQSASFVKFLHQKFGSSGLLALLNLNKDGSGCLESVKTISTQSLSQLESLWQRDTLGLFHTTISFQNLAPYLVIGLLILVIPLSIGVRHKSGHPRNI